MTQTLVGYLRAWPAYRWILLMAGVYFVVAFYGTWVNYIDLHFNTLGIYDLSINQQALSSTIHGNYPYPFYEATNCGKNGRCSFLQVHPIFVAYFVAVPYGFEPSAATLFAIQDLGLALAAFPLFLLTRELTKSTRLSILTCAIYLVWLPAFSGIFSFHWEAFMPLEIFTIFYLWLREKYLWAVPVAFLTYITLEIGSVFLFCMAAFFLVPWGELLLGYVRARWELGAMPPGPRRSRLAAALHRVRLGLFRPSRVRASLALMAGSIAAYVALHEFVTQGGWLLGLPPLPSMYQIPLSQPVYAATFTLGNFFHAGSQKLVFWIVMFGTLGGIPLLAPRTAILWGPWVAYTTVTTAGFYHMGNQYGFLAAAVLFPGFIYGLVRLQGWANGSHVGTWWNRFWNGGDALPEWDEGPADRDRSSPAGVVGTPSTLPRAVDRNAPTVAARPNPRSTVAVPAFIPPAPSQPRAPWTLERRRRRSWQIIGLVVTGMVAFNLALNPLIPFTASLRAQRPFAAQSNLGLTGPPDYAGYSQVMQMVDLIPSRAVVAVSPDLMTLLAGDPYAYPLLNNIHWPLFPFNASVPQYVILAVHGDTYTPGWLRSGGLYSPGNLTVRAWAPETYLGGMILFERDYSGPVETIGSVPTFTGASYNALSGIVASQAGVVVSDPSVGPIITTGNTVNSKGHVQKAVGRLFQTPEWDLVPGNYSITVNITGSGSLVKNASINVSSIHLAAFEYPIATWQIIYGNTTQPRWQVITIAMNLTAPVLDFQVLGTNEQNWFTTSVNSVTIVRVS